VFNTTPKAPAVRSQSKSKNLLENTPRPTQPFMTKQTFRTGSNASQPISKTPTEPPSKHPRLKKYRQGVKRRLRKNAKRVSKFTQYFFIFYIVLGVFSYFTNPFTRFTTVKEPFATDYNSQGQIELVEKNSLQLKQNFFYHHFAFLKSAYHIVTNVYAGSKRSRAENIQDIVADIHNQRFNPDNPFLISGDHFSMLYPRSLGIFYHSLLDPRTALSDQDWAHRQQIYLQTAAYALEVYAKSKELSTTIVPVGPQSVTLMNIYQKPSDTLYSLLYAIEVMRSTQPITTIYPYNTNQSSAQRTLATTEAANELLNKYRVDLQRHLAQYQQDVYDSNTGLVRQDILLSSTKDIVKRQSAFYDNVIYWRTLQMAQELELAPRDDTMLNELRSRILTTFWDTEQGHFLEDLSPESKAYHYYSSDWLIAIMTGFLSPSNPDDRPYLEKSVAYIQAEKLDQPFGLHFQQTDRPERQYLANRLGAPEYGGTAIWSNWGQEYIKVLLLLYKATNNPQYKLTATQQLQAYENNILEYHGFPEVYDHQGKMMETPLYKSVRQTGWVVSFEQAQKMYADYIHSDDLLQAPLEKVDSSLSLEPNN
jgi:hypothetical protein